MNIKGGVNRQDKYYIKIKTGGFSMTGILLLAVMDIYNYKTESIKAIGH